MKTHIREHPNPEKPGSTIFLVVRDDDAYVMGQHATRIDAERQMNSLKRRQGRHQ